jgi:hypothetical protein
LAVIAVSHGRSLWQSLLARLDHGVHDPTVWIAVALTAVIVAAMVAALRLLQEYAFRPSGRRR